MPRLTAATRIAATRPMAAMSKVQCQALFRRQIQGNPAVPSIQVVVVVIRVVVIRAAVAVAIVVMPPVVPAPVATVADAKLVVGRHPSAAFAARPGERLACQGRLDQPIEPTPFAVSLAVAWIGFRPPHGEPHVRRKTLDPILAPGQIAIGFGNPVSAAWGRPDWRATGMHPRPSADVIKAQATPVNRAAKIGEPCSQRQAGALDNGGGAHRFLKRGRKQKRVVAEQ